MFKILRYKGFLCKGDNNKTKPRQEAIDNGYFEDAWGSYKDKTTGKILSYRKVRITPKGVKALSKSKLLQWKSEMEEAKNKLKNIKVI